MENHQQRPEASRPEHDGERVPGRDQAGADGDARDDGTFRSSGLLAGALALLVAVGAVGLYLGLSDGDGGGGAAPRSGAAPAGGSHGGSGSLAEPAAVVDFPTLDGDTASLEDYRGKVVVLNLWGTWCPPCRHEIPHLVDLQERIEPRGGTVVGLAVDSGSPSSIRSFVEEFGINYPIWYARGQRVVGHYDAMGYPTTLLIDREGVIRERYLGPQTTESLLEDLEPYLSRG